MKNKNNSIIEMRTILLYRDKPSKYDLEPLEI